MRKLKEKSDRPALEEKNSTMDKITGKTYTLYGGESTSDGFYSKLQQSADRIILMYGNDPLALLNLISSTSQRKSHIRKAEKYNSLFSELMIIIRNEFSAYLTNIDKHLKSLSFRQSYDKTLAASPDQYLLYMLEIELTNRINIPLLSQCSEILAMLPHCLRDFSRTCLSSPDEVDYLCRGCSRVCTINRLSRLLKSKRIKPYIWMEADLKKLFTSYHKSDKSIGILGIACIPELAAGMRLCRKYNVPAAGIPLDANRCRRWMGSFHDNSVNLNKLEELLGSVNAGKPGI